ncbi:hypothetical protein EVAR_62882_1 [Eumeta japonica]|uniref:Uncharacterized protein n=1 Tax=Eumeta variegata TaxID=151549 RepID=A0A4C1ZSK3_EUMVA|nr:hypothetical protein EVAR_62882_1 [Eumeta japonica]
MFRQVFAVQRIPAPAAQSLPRAKQPFRTVCERKSYLRKKKKATFVLTNKKKIKETIQRDEALCGDAEPVPFGESVDFGTRESGVSLERESRKSRADPSTSRPPVNEGAYMLVHPPSPRMDDSACSQQRLTYIHTLCILKFIVCTRIAPRGLLRNQNLKVLVENPRLELKD